MIQSIIEIVVATLLIIGLIFEPKLAKAERKILKKWLDH